MEAGLRTTQYPVIAINCNGKPTKRRKENRHIKHVFLLLNNVLLYARLM